MVCVQITPDGCNNEIKTRYKKLCECMRVHVHMVCVCEGECGFGCVYLERIIDGEKEGIKTNLEIVP